MPFTALPATVPQFASGTGASVATGLTATGAEWVENVTQGGATFGIIEYPFSGSPDLSAVLPGHKLNVSAGFTNTENKVLGATIWAVDNTAKTIQVTSFERLNATLDETGVSATGTTVTTDGARIIEPSSAKKLLGWLSPEKISDGILNWLSYWLYAWIYMIQQNYPTGYYLGAKLTEGDNVSLTDNGDNTLRLDVNLGSAASLSTPTITQAAHGFAVGNAIRYTGSAWAKGKADTLATSRGNWVVTSVPTVNTFIACRVGRVTVTGHGLGAAGTLLYLSADTAGALTSTRPVGNTTRALGHFTVLVRVVDADTLEVLGGEPQFHAVYAEYVASGDVSISTLAFTVDLGNVGNTVRIVGSAQNRDVNGTGTVEISFGGNFSSSAYIWYKQQTAEDSPWAFTGTETASTDSFEIGIGCGPGGSPDYMPFSYNGILSLGCASGSAGTIKSWHYAGRAFQEVDTTDDFRMQLYNGWVRGSSTAANNITSISFANSTKCRLRSGDRIQLLIDRMPDA
jgi:hypothetical protein